MKIKLKFPIEFEGKKVEELEMRRPKVKDIRDVSQKTKDDTEKELLLFAKLTGQPVELIEELDLADYKQLQEAYMSFLS